MGKATPSVPSSQSSVHDQDEESVQFSPEEFANNPRNHFVLPRAIWFKIRTGEISFIEADLLLLSEDYIHLGAAKTGCWASVKQLARILQISRRTVQIARRKLLKLGLLIPGKPHEARPGVFRDAYYTVMTPPPTTGASPCAPPLRAHGDAPNREEKTKDRNTRGAAPPRPLTPEKTDMPFLVINGAQQSPPETELARRFYQHLKDHRKDLPDKTPLPSSFPKKVWPAKFKRLTKLVGETAVSSMLDRLIENWKDLAEDARPTSAGQFCSPGYFQHVLPKLLARCKAGQPVKLPASLRTDWDQIKDLHWPGDKAAVKAALVNSDAVLQDVWRKLRKLVKRGDEYVKHESGYVSRRRLEHWEAMGVRVFPQIDGLRPGDLMSRIFEMIVTLGAKASPDYSGPKFTLTIEALDKHLVVGKLLDQAGASKRKLLDYLKGGDQ